MNADATSKQTVVIVGAGLAGGKAAVTLREEGWRGRIVLLGAGDAPRGHRGRRAFLKGKASVI